MKKSILYLAILICFGAVQFAQAQCSDSEITIVTCNYYTWHGDTYTESGDYFYESQDASGCFNLEILHLVINTAVITSQPLSQIMCTAVGSSVSFNVTTNVDTPIYTWQYRTITITDPGPVWKNITSANAGAIYTGFNTATLGVTRITPTLPAAETEYRLIIAGGQCNNLLTDAAKLTIIDIEKSGKVYAPPSVCLGGDMTLVVAGYLGTHLQWQSSPNASGPFTDLVHENGETYTINSVTLATDKYYRVAVSSTCSDNAVFTAVQTIKIDAQAVAGTISAVSGSSGGTICSGSSANLKVSGNTGKIQWEYSTDGNDYFDSPVASDTVGVPFTPTSTNNTLATYSITNILGELYLRARITNGMCSSVYTSPIHYVIGNTASVGNAAASSTTLCSGNATTLTLSGSDGVITWEKSLNWTATSPTWIATTNHSLSYTTPNLTISAAYRAKVSIGSCSVQSTVYSNVMPIYVTPKAISKSITANITVPNGKTPQTALCTSDISKTFTLDTGYTGTIQWQKSTVSRTTGFVDIVGATGTSYTVINATAGANYYRVKFTNSCGDVVYNIAQAVYYNACKTASAEMTDSEIKIPFEVVAYPNPFDQNFSLKLTSSSQENITLAVYDMTGRLIEKSEMEASNITERSIGNQFPTGVYNLIVTQGKDVKMLRVVKR